MAEVDLTAFPNTEAWAEKCIKLVPNYEKVPQSVVTVYSLENIISGQWRRCHCFRRILQVKVLNADLTLEILIHQL